MSTPHRTPSSRSVPVLLGAALALSLGLAGCSTAGSAAPSPSPSPAAQGDAPATTDSSPSVDATVASTTLGKVVVDGKGMTAYYFDADIKDSGTCTGACAAAWPAIEASTTKPKVSGITGTVGTIKGVDGGRQITIDGRPIYTFVGDKKAGDVTGQGDKGVWYVVNPDGSEQKK
ncbi:hypothetical protein ITJ50_11890 [Curtobacterium sp. VKM Ac-2889]|uniref:COG4315 family predicted lipoprotein n=1 Tax=unclassified Curtobacterium TaxID=257496 RepID=UPI00188C031A|nr:MULTISPECIES: hypothetical protein [unclassified Curtobacterium]MBF4597688.1 hypothetical protein [Curtobacterium sp. VKM Ac-1796]MBF4611920.1 hypothetical protein [Curtobacterium sp. VKM Ac-2889]